MRARGDGDGWVLCASGHRHWGRYGAAGLLLADAGRVLLQHRVEWSHEGGTWGVPGGARSSTEDALTAALREAGEEAGIDAALVRPSAVFVEDHGGWAYTTVLAEATGPLDARPTDPESIEVRWVDLEGVRELPLHSGFGGAWDDLEPLLGRRLHLVIDVANVMGSTPDGWWRDRAGAADRLLVSFARLAKSVDAAAVGPPGVPDRLSSWLPDVVAVLEGAARSAGARPAGVDLVRAAGSGDDAVVEQVRDHRRVRPRDPVMVVTADRGLVSRVEQAGASAVRPSLLRRLAAAG